MLAETLGFEKLDLVEALVKDGQQVVADLAADDIHRAQQTPAVANGLMHSGDAHQNRMHGPGNTHPTSSSKPYTPGSSVVIHTKEEIEQNKKKRVEQRRMQRARGHHANFDDEENEETTYSAEEMAILRAQSLRAAAERPLYTSDRVTTGEPRYPHVFASGSGGNVLNAFGAKFSLPAGTSRLDHDFYEEVTIPPPKQLPMRTNERLIPIPEMDALARGAFPGYKSLNRLQSVVYPLGYGSNENLLVCAPTGAGKTDVAMLTVLRAIKMHANSVDPVIGRQGNPAIGTSRTANTFGIRHDDFKIIYVAPMKALASEVVAKFSKRLRYLGVKVRELTGDMQMTRKEIAETQMIVTTPEKWDVVTRKPTGEGELAAKVKLLIIDEVHLLHEERGAVIETIVARTLRLVESSQSLIRIVGLSATLPNYVDVADFLRVNRYQGLFFFDSSFRPVPLEQHFLGVKGKANSPVARQKMDKATFEKLQELVEQGHQIMIFVHARKETVKTACGMRDLCREEGILDLVTQARDQGNPDAFRRDIMESRNRELKELFETGFGIHHAGMLRKDRNLSERLFETGVTRVLCCTATLAWGVNLPAYAVLIKGTDIYDSSLGRFSDLSILDVLQIFGRAGRPQYEKVGVGYIITSHDKLSHYVDAITSQHPIESKFKSGMIDALNAEIALGSVNSISDGITWLSYTYLFTRMRRNPLAYGMLADEVLEDPQLGAKRLHEITAAAKYLARCKMLEMDESSSQFTITELGRIAARYYITYRTIEVFNEKLRHNMTEADLLAVFGHATDFEQIIPRENEIQELKKLQEKVPCEIQGACDTSAGKANLLLQAFISQLYIDDFALVSDSAYVAQNGGRVMRALFETALSRRWAGTAAAALGLARSIERRLWPFDHPLAQSTLRPDMIHQLTRWADEVQVKELASMSKDELASLCRINARHADAIRQAARRFPMLSVQYRLKPLTYDLLRVDVSVRRDYDWEDADRDGGETESFYVWIEDEEGDKILQSKRTLFHPRSAPVQMITFTIDQAAIASSSGVSIRWISERWIGSEDVVFASFDALRMADLPQAPTALLDLPLLQTAQCCSGLGVAGEAIASHVSTLNALQTQAFSAFTDRDSNVIAAMPHRSGRTLLAHMAICRAVQRMDGAALILVVYPSMASAHQSMVAFRRIALGVQIEIAKEANELTQSGFSQALRVVFTVPGVIDDALSKQTGWLDPLRMVILEDVHITNARNELAISVLRHSASTLKARWIATTVSLENVASLQSWLGVQDGEVFNFSTRNRPSALRTSVVTFDLAHSLHLLKAMVKPAYDRIKQSVGSAGRALVFVPSRTQAISVARDLVRQSASELDVSAFVGSRANSSDLEPYLAALKDSKLAEVLLGGVGVVTEGMAPRDKRMILALYESNAIRVLVASRDAISSLSDAHCRCVIIMSTQFMRLEETQAQIEAIYGENLGKSGQRIGRARLVDYSLSDILRMQAFAAAPNPMPEENEGLGPMDCFIFCQGDQADLLRRMIDGGLVLESSIFAEDDRERVALLWSVLRGIADERIGTRADILRILQWTYARHRMPSNPSYYEAASGSEDDVQDRLLRAADDCIKELVRLRCIEETGGAASGEQERVHATPLGSSLLGGVASFNILSRLLALHQHYQMDSDVLARRLVTLSSFRTFDLRLEKFIKGQIRPSQEAERHVLDATRSCTPSEMLARFAVPRLSRKAEGRRADQSIDGKAAQADGRDDKEVEEAPLTETQRKALLLAIYFAPLHDIRTPAEAARIKSKSSAKTAAAAAAASKSETSENGTSRGPNGQECETARAGLQSAMFALVLNILLAV